MDKGKYAAGNTRQHRHDRTFEAMSLIPELLISVPKAAELLGVSRRTVYLLLASGELRRRKIRRRTMIHRDDIIQFASESLRTERQD